MSSKTSLHPEEARLLREVLWKRQPSLLHRLDSLGVIPLTTEQREELRQVLADELCETGLQPDDEPNERGLRLDDLIGQLGSF